MQVRLGLETRRAAVTRLYDVNGWSRYPSLALSCHKGGHPSFPSGSLIRSLPPHESPDVHKQKNGIPDRDAKAGHPSQAEEDPGGIGRGEYKESRSVLVAQQVNGEQAERHRQPVQAPVSEKFPHVQPRRVIEIKINRR